MTKKSKFILFEEDFIIFRKKKRYILILKVKIAYLNFEC